MVATNGAELTRALAQSGTGADKLAVCRQTLADVYQREHRTASAAEVIEALEESGVAGEVTIEKARTFAGIPKTTAAVKARGPELPIEERLLGGALPGPELDAGKAPEAKPADPPKPQVEDDEPKGPPPEWVGPKKVVKR